MTLPTLTTKRLVLRQLVKDDAQALFNVLSDDLVMKYWSSAPHRDLAETQTYVAANADPEGPYKTWAITRDGASAIGWVVLILRRKDNFELGYILGRDHWRQGYLYEAAAAVIDYAFSKLLARRIMADTDPENHGSAGLLSKLGFLQEGYLRAEWETHIGVRDSLIFGLLRDEWELQAV